MRLKQISHFSTAVFLLFSIPAFVTARSLSDSVSVSENVKIGPEELGRLFSPEELFRKEMEQKFKQKAEEETVFKKYLSLRRFHALLDETETFMSPAESSLPTLYQLHEMYQESKNWKGLSLINNTYAVYYGKKGELNKSLQFFKESLQAKERLNDKKGMAAAAESIAELSRLAGKYDDAVFYYDYNARINASLPQANHMAEAYINIAEIKAAQGKFAEAERYVLKKAFPVFQRMGNKTGRLSCFEHLAEIYHLQNRLSEAKWFCLQANTLAAKLHNLPAQVSSLMKVARIKNEIGDTEMALNDYKTAERLARQNSFTAKLVEIKSDIVEIYRKKGNYNAAGTELDEYNRLKNSLLNGNM